MVSPEYQILNFSSLADRDAVFSFGDNFMIGDNIGQPVKIDENLMVPFKCNNTMVLLCVKGMATFKVNSIEYKMKESDLLTIVPGSLGQFMGSSDDAELAFMAFRDERYFDSLSPYFASQLYSQISEYAMITMDQEQLSYFLDVYRMMKRDVSNPDFLYKREAILGYMQVFMAHATQRYGSQDNVGLKDGKNNRSSEIYLQFLKLLSEYHNSERSVSFYADKMCLTPKYLSQVVLNVSGKYATDIIRDQVILEAKAMLKTRKYSVQEIAELLNFPNPSFFGKYFKSATGCSPRQYMLK